MFLKSEWDNKIEEGEGNSHVGKVRGLPPADVHDGGAGKLVKAIHSS